MVSTQAQSPALRPLERLVPTLWGLGPVELHDRYWASRSVCVVRRGEAATLPRDAELFLLTDARTLAVFGLRPLVDALFWAKPAVIFVRLNSRRPDSYRESIVTDDSGVFLRFTRHYAGEPKPAARLALTRDRRLARNWQTPTTTWRELRQQTRGRRRRALGIDGRCYDRSCPEDLDSLVGDLVASWTRPGASIEGIREVRPGVWAEVQHGLGSDVVFIGPTWVGAGRALTGGQTVLGPAALWDDRALRPAAAAMRWDRLDPTSRKRQRILPRTGAPWRRISKRAFDMVFATVALLATMPLYPLIMLAIWLEDGRPFLFTHRRETLGGRQFPCLKFRSMGKDADRLKAQLAAQNQSDGPQFFIDDDPRVTRVGRFLRKTNLDELPQFFNVLLGHMSVVGPRPSPRQENQYCPAWREARLSVKPGITGLWQVSRTRRGGLDFQEWIKFDLEYVERANWRLDLLILLKTARIVVGG